MKSHFKNNWNKVLVLGARGQLGRRIVALIEPAKVIAASREDVDLSNPTACLAFLEDCQPDVVINAAAYTQVDRAESESALACKVNAEAPGKIAQWCALNHVPFVHFSTDYVFSGVGSAPWLEDDFIDPCNVYGRTKAEGERLVVEAGGRFLIFRTSWIYDTAGGNFLRTMLKLGQEREVLRVVNDQVGAPTWAEDLAFGALSALQHALEKDVFPSGIYHLCNQGETSWYFFAKAIFEEAVEQGFHLKIQQVDPILSSDYPTPARRPKNSRLNTDKVYEQLDVRLPEWRASLRKGLKKGLSEFKEETR
jgi:dTDP-4-dehydrorhamnose reductase